MKSRKSLAEALVLPKLNYCNVVYAQMPMYMINRLQRIQNATTGYAFGRYTTVHNYQSSLVTHKRTYRIQCDRPSHQCFAMNYDQNTC